MRCTERAGFKEPALFFGVRTGNRRWAPPTPGEKYFAGNDVGQAVWRNLPPLSFFHKCLLGPAASARHQVAGDWLSYITVLNRKFISATSRASFLHHPYIACGLSSGPGEFTVSSIRLKAYNSRSTTTLERGVSALLHLRVVSPFFAFRQSSNSPAFCTIPKGAVVETLADSDQGGLVSIKLEDQPLLAFMRDLQERAELLNSTASLSPEESAAPPPLLPLSGQ